MRNIFKCLLCLEKITMQECLFTLNSNINALKKKNVNEIIHLKTMVKKKLIKCNVHR